jgi:hypothetical protein
MGQVTEAFPWEGPLTMIRDRDRIYGDIVARRLRAMGIRDKPTAPASPWQNGFAERLIGSIRRECWIISSFSARPICAEFCDHTRAMTTTSGSIDHWTRMRRSLARFSGPGASNRSRSWSSHTNDPMIAKSPFSTAATRCGYCACRAVDSAPRTGGRPSPRQGRAALRSPQERT